MSLKDEPIPYNPAPDAGLRINTARVERRRDYLNIDKSIEHAINRSTRKVFAILGVDLEDPESVEEFRKDLRFSGRVRRLCERGTLALVVAMLSAIGYAIVEIFRAGMGQK